MNPPRPLEPILIASDQDVARGEAYDAANATPLSQDVRCVVQDGRPENQASHFVVSGKNLGESAEPYGTGRSVAANPGFSDSFRATKKIPADSTPQALGESLPASVRPRRKKAAATTNANESHFCVAARESAVSDRAEAKLGYQ